MTELEEIRAFISEPHIDDSIGQMEEQLEKAIGYSQRVGELANAAEHRYEKAHASFISRLEELTDETETTRKAKLMGWLADNKKELNDLKVMRNSLKQTMMSLMQAIRTRREEPINRSRP